MKEYLGYRQQRMWKDWEVTLEVVVTVHETGRRPHLLDPRFDLRNHSPTGFEWGYAGSGPAQLALALAADVLGEDERALSLYQDLKSHLIVGLPHDGWILEDVQLLDVLLKLNPSR